jgi:serine/threonine protein kinase
MRTAPASELEYWLSTGEILEQDSRGPKVVQLSDGTFLKIFRNKRPLLARWRPDAKRFIENAQKLQDLGIATLQPIEGLWLQRRSGISACRYQPLDGISLEQIFKKERLRFDELLPAFASYIAYLHQLGIYFRSLHLGNVLLLADGQFGLIDFLDIKFNRRPLSQALVQRNFSHLHNYLKRRKIQDFPMQELLNTYKKRQLH